MSTLQKLFHREVSSVANSNKGKGTLKLNAQVRIPRSSTQCGDSAKAIRKAETIFGIESSNGAIIEGHEQRKRKQAAQCASVRAETEARFSEKRVYFNFPVVALPLLACL